MYDINRILCPVDFSEYSEHALAYAMRLAKWYGATVQVLHVMPPLAPSTVSELGATSRALTARNLNALIERYRIGDVDVASELIESADVVEKIRDSAERFDADLIVAGSHGRSGVQRVLLGSVVEALLHKAGRPLMVVPSHVADARLEHPADLRRILCAVDFAPASLAALELAVPMAEETAATLMLLHVIEPAPDYGGVTLHTEGEEGFRKRLAALVPVNAVGFCNIETVVAEGGASRQILRIAAEQDCDLIVLGVHGRNAFDLAFFGSNSKEVIRRSRCPVLIVPELRRPVLRAMSSEDQPATTVSSLNS